MTNTGGDGSDSGVVDALIIGAGPAGLSAALNLGRSDTSVVMVDADRPRNAATLRSHGFLTRDGVAPHELRKLARAEIAEYPSVRIMTRARVTEMRRYTCDGARYFAEVESRSGTASVRARSVLIATGLRETLPDVPGIRGFYGMSLFSCAACDAWELRGERLALIGQTPDVASRARLIARFTPELVVFTHGATPSAELLASGVRVVSAPITEMIGTAGKLEAVVAGGESIAVSGGFVRPEWSTGLDWLNDITPETDSEGHLIVDRGARTSVAGLYAAGDIASPGPQQLIVAAGQGARAAAVMVHDLVGITTSH